MTGVALVALRIFVSVHTASPAPAPAGAPAAVAPATRPALAEDELELLTDPAAPDEAAVKALLARVAAGSPPVREAAIRRLLKAPAAAAAPPTVDAFATSNLTQRLAILDLLRAWHAPINGIDPWLPESITTPRLDALKQWAAAAAPATAATTGPTTLPAAELSAARADIDALLAAPSADDARAIRERLARYGERLLPEVYAQLAAAGTDSERAALRALRYRLVCSDRLALAFPEALERLASVAQPTRLAALDELSTEATPADQRLLLELFADPDPLFREKSLKLMQSVGGSGAGGAMAKLLADPEPNVRAAVLKQLAESPQGDVAGEIAAYVGAEQDADLVVHAVRVLRAARGEEAMQALKSLLAHPSWRVRAEAVEAIQEAVENLPNEQKSQYYAALIRVMDDPDGYVIARAVGALSKSNLTSAIEPMTRAAEKHPELAPEVVKALVSQENLGRQAMPQLKAFCAHANPTVRAAAVAGYAQLFPTGCQEELAAALKDSDARVRTAAAKATADVLATLRPPETTQASFLGLTRTIENDRAKWLNDFRAGTGRPEWLAGLLPSLEAMLKAPSGEERVRAAIPLIAAHREDVALPVLQSSAAADPKLIPAAAEALLWLPRDKRLALFDQLMGKSAGESERHAVIAEIGKGADPANAQPLWKLLAAPAQTPPATFHAVFESLRQLYFGERYYNPRELSESRRQSIAQAAGERATSGSADQKSVALMLLAAASREQAKQHAQRILDDKSSGDWLRLDALQVLLMSAPHDEAVKLATARVADPVLRKVAVPYLALEDDALRQFRGDIYVYPLESQGRAMTFGNGQPVDLAPPEGLPVEPLKPMVADASDPKLAACAGYLLALEHDRRGFDALRSYWESNGKDDRDLTRLVYRAASALNDDSLTPLLEQIYRGMGGQDYYIREFYWTIRNMKGEQALKLRKTIRDEVTMDRLR